MHNNVLVSVIMTVYNTDKYLAEAIDSILNQTYTNFEFIIIDDCSRDRSVEIVESFSDKRIRFYKSSENIGLTKQLNRGISLATGEYIARMDSDDISLPNRFEEQVRFLNQNLEVGLCGTFSQVFTEFRRYSKTILPTTHDSISAFLLFGSPIVHPSIMIRKSVLVESGITYPEDAKVGQDYALYSLLYNKTRFYNIPKVLLKYRTHDNSISQINKSGQSQLGVIVGKKFIVEFLRELTLPERESYCQKHQAIIRTSVESITQLRQLLEWVMFLVMHNDTHHKYKRREFLEGVGHFIYRKIVRDSVFSLRSLSVLTFEYNSILGVWPWKYKLLYLLRCLKAVLNRLN